MKPAAAEEAAAEEVLSPEGKLLPLEQRRPQFRELNGRIMLYVTTFLMQNKRLPQREEVAKEFDMSARWVVEHMKYLTDYINYKEQLATLTPMILQSFGVRTIAKGRSQDVVTWLKIMHGWIDPAVAALAPLPPLAQDTPIGQLTAEDDELRKLETEYWQALYSRSQKSTGDTEAPAG